MKKCVAIILIYFTVVFSASVENSESQQSESHESGSEESKPFCADFDFMAESSTIQEIVINALTKDGPNDGICSDTSYKWIFYGFGYRPKCACMVVAPQNDISPKDGERCVNWILSSSTDTLKQSWILNYENSKAFAPANGWCPKGQYKAIVKAELIGAPKDTCYCIKNFNFFYSVSS